MGQENVASTLESAGFDGLSEEAAAALLSAARPAAIAAGQPLFSESEEAHAFHLITSGELRAVDRSNHDSIARVLRAGEALDELQVLAGVENSVTVVAAVDSTVASIDGDVLDSLADRYPDVQAAVDRLHRRQLLSRLHTVLGTFDREFLDVVEEMAGWVHLPKGGLLFEQNNDTDAIYLVVSGRLRVSMVERDGSSTVLGDCCRGELVGELAFFGAQRHEERVHAIRDSVLVGFSRDEFENLVSRRPEILRHVTRTLAERLHRAPVVGSAGGGVTNIALVAITSGVELHEFANRLTAALAPLGRTLHLTSGVVAELMDEPGISEAWDGSDDEARLLEWLESREASHRFVVYEADPEVSLWTRRCTRQADRVILVADASRDPAVGDVETALRELEGKSEDARRVLALVHPNGDTMPSGTARWLDSRKISEFYHVRWNVEHDFGRIARVLAGRAVGIVLGGGGARGFAHIGILRALEEGGVPVDMIGGTSMGAAVAAQYAMGWTSDQLARMFRRVYIDIRPQTDYTLPFLSVVGTAKADKCGVMVFGEVAVEDCWIPYFCISSNLSTAQMVIHRRGLLRKVTLASASLPGFVPPVLEGRELLVDGGLLNNVPTDVMRQLGAGVVMASEVSVEEDAAFLSDRIPTTWELFRGKFRRAASAPRFPGLVELAVRASMLHSTSRQNAAVVDADFCFRPPIDQFGMVDFLKLDDIVRAGYEYAATVMPDLRSNPQFQPLLQQ